MKFYLLIYLIIVIYSFILFFLNINRNKKKKFFLIFTCIFLLLIMGLRSVNVGTDTKTYVNLYKHIASGSDIFNVIKSAPLYVIYNKLVSILFNDDTGKWIIFLNSLIIVTGIGIFIYRNSKNIVISMLLYISLYFYFIGFNISRQFIALILVLNSYYYIKNNMIKKYIVLISMAIAIHNTAIVGIVLYPICKIEWSKSKVYVFSLLSILTMFLYEKILNIFLKIFPRYNMYMGSGRFSINDVGEGKKILVSIFYLCFVFLALYVLSYKKYESSLENKIEIYRLTSIVMFASIIGIFFYNNLLISRIEIYFSIFSIIFIPNLTEYIGGRIRLLIYYLVILLTIFSLIVQLNSNISGVIPYEPIWKIYY